MRKSPLKALLSIFLTTLFLFNTPVVMAAEAEKAPLAESPAVTKSVTDSGPPALPPPPEPEETPLVWAEVGTFEELYAALEASTPSETTQIRLTSNITVPKIESECTSKPNHSIELDLGPYTLYVEGTLRLQIGLTLTGSAGEDALIRIRSGGTASINHVPIHAGDRCAIWQEEGAIFTFTPTPDFTGVVHYAEKAVAMPHSFLSWQVAMPVAVVRDGKTLAEVLPKTDSVHLYPNNGTNMPEVNIAVEWNADAYQAELDTRVRTLITGSYPDAIALQQPVCLVVFQNGNPAIFLDAYGMESYGRPKAKVKIELMEPELGCRFEWSQDGENWLSADAVETPSWDGRLAFTVSFPQEVPPTYPYYLSAVVDYPDGSVGYSDVLVIQQADSQCGSGGNRRGGTGVTPPELPPLGGSMGGAAPNKPNHSGESEGTKPPDGGAEDEPPASVAVELVSPHVRQAVEHTATATTTPAQPEPPPSATQQTPDTALTQDTQTTTDAQEAITPVVAEVEPPAQTGGASGAKPMAQIAIGVITTGVIITLTMTWGSWSKRMISLLHKLLKR